MMNPFICYKFYAASEEHKRHSLKKMKSAILKKSPLKSSITIRDSRKCNEYVASNITIDTVKESLNNKTVPEIFRNNALLLDCVSFSLYVWTDSHLVDFFLEPDLVQVANVDELNYLIKTYKRKLVKIYKKHAQDAIKEILEIDSYMNQLEHDRSGTEFPVARHMIRNNDPKYKERIDEMFKKSMIEKLYIENYKDCIKGSGYFERNKQNGRIPRALLSIYLKYSFLNGDSHAVMKRLIESHYKSAIQYHIDEIVASIQDIGMVTNTCFKYDGTKFVGISSVSNSQKTKIINNLLLKRKNTSRIITRLHRAKLDNSGYVRYSPSRVLNYLKLKKGIDSITDEE